MEDWSRCEARLIEHCVSLRASIYYHCALKVDAQSHYLESLATDLDIQLTEPRPSDLIFAARYPSVGRSALGMWREVSIEPDAYSRDVNPFATDMGYSQT